MKKIFFLLALMVGGLMPALAQTTAPDSIYVVKDGFIVSSYEVGKDVDNVTFVQKQKLAANTVMVGEETVELKSAVFMQQGDFVYGFFSPEEGLTTMNEIAASSAYLQVTMSPELVGENIQLSTVATDYPDAFFMVAYIDNKKMDEDDDYEPVSISSDDWKDNYASGSLHMEQDGDNLVMDFATEPKEGVDAFAGNYNGAFSAPVANPYFFNVDDNESQTRAVFAEKLADGVAFYITSGNIDKAKDLDNCHYYARLFVPNNLMDGDDINIQGTKKYELQLVDHVSDLNNTKYFDASNGMAGNASGYVSVLDRGDGSYTLIADVENLGLKDETHNLQFYYKGTPMVYDLTEPSQYAVGDGDPVELKSAVYTVDAESGLHTIYLSAKPGVTTLEGMADADVVVTVPEDFVNDNRAHGFSGTETNAMISVTYGGDTYSQATTTNAAEPIAIGGNAKATLKDGKANIDFTVFGMSKYATRSLKGHFEGSITRLN